MCDRGLADTTVFIARESGQPLDEDALPDEISVSAVTVGELRAGVLAADDVETRDRRLATLTQALITTTSKPRGFRSSKSDRRPAPVP